MGRWKPDNRVIKTYDTWSLIDISTPKYPDATMKISNEDVPLLKLGRICFGVYPRIWHLGKLRVFHTLINPSYRVSDHINRDKTDNRRHNLRECNQSENCMNVGLSSNNKTGIKGVSWDVLRGKWFSSIKKNNKTIALGRYDNIDFAIGARQQAEREMFGEFASTN